MSTLKLIASSSWGIYNKEIAKKIGLDEAIILGELASEHDYWLKQNELTEDGYFYSTVENIEKETTLSDHRQRKAINTLKGLNLIDIQLKGLPAKRYIKMNEIEIEKLLIGGESNNTLRTSSVKSKELDLEKFNINNNKDNKNNKDKDTVSKDTGESKDSPSDKSNNKSNISNKNKDIDKNKAIDSNNSIDDNLKSRNLKKVLLPYIQESFIDEKVKEVLIDWLLDVFANGKTLTLKQLINQCDLLTEKSKTKEELIDTVQRTLEGKWSTFRFVIENKNKTKTKANNNNSNSVRITEQKRTATFGNEVF